MKIGLLTQEYHTGETRFGGVGRAIGKIAHWLAEHGHEVTVYMHGRHSGETEERPGLRLVQVPLKPRIHWRLRPFISRMSGTIRGVCWYYEANGGLEDKILADFHSGKIEVLIANRGVTAPGLMIKRRLPTVVRLQHSMIKALKVEKVHASLLDYLLHFMEWRAIRRAGAVYSPSRVVGGYVGKNAGREVEVIPTPMFTLRENEHWDTIKSTYGIPDHYLLFWGGLLLCKGIETLIRAVPLLLDRDPDCAFVFVGEQKYHNRHHHKIKQSLEDLADRYKGRIIILPNLDHDILLPIIHHCRVAVLPSIFDNLPNTVLEAMYLGCVIVATTGSSIDEVIEPEKDGILVKMHNPEALASAMIRAWHLDDQARTAMGTSAAEKVRRVCNPDLVMRKIVDLCQRAILTFQHQQLGSPI